ncbi:FAD:protein FMN transferase [Elusimicrobiota bacterium]
MFEGKTMGTTYHIILTAAEITNGSLEDLKKDVQALLDHLDKDLMSTYSKKSEISRFNRIRNTEPFPVSVETAEVVRLALAISHDTNGAFDPTVGSLVRLWGFGSEKKPSKVPTDAQIKAKKNIVGYKRLHVQNSPLALVKDRSNMKIDLAAIAKGYCADAVASLLKDKGYEDYFVEIGGEVAAYGKNHRNEYWNVGIERPEAGRMPGEKLHKVVVVKNGAVATSGNYRNFFIQNGKRYSHIIDPHTGSPVTHMLASAAVIAPTCREADAVATALMVLGTQKGIEWIEGHSKWDAMLLEGNPDGTFREVYSSGFKNRTR